VFLRPAKLRAVYSLLDGFTSQIIITRTAFLSRSFAVVCKNNNKSALHRVAFRNKSSTNSNKFIHIVTHVTIILPYFLKNV